VTVRPLSAELGGGYEALFPQLARSVVGYGTTRQDAINDLLEAVTGFLEAVEKMKIALPDPETGRA
jgi:hypothetical protein